MFERFSKSAKVAVVIAQEEARELRSPHIQVEHVLLGVASSAERDLRTMLDGVGLDVDGLRAALREGQAFGDEDAEALKSIGIDLGAVRESLDATFGADTLERAVPADRRGLFGKWSSGHIPFTREAKKVLELSLREALAHKDDYIGSEHVLLGILRAPSPAAKALIESRIEIDVLRRKVIALLDAAA